MEVTVIHQSKEYLAIHGKSIPENNKENKEHLRIGQGCRKISFCCPSLLYDCRNPDYACTTGTCVPATTEADAPHICVTCENCNQTCYNGTCVDCNLVPESCTDGYCQPNGMCTIGKCFAQFIEKNGSCFDCGQIEDSGEIACQPHHHCLPNIITGDLSPSVACFNCHHPQYSCPTGFYCGKTTNRCVSCLDGSSPCTDGTMCDENTGRCVSCRDNPSICGSGKICEWVTGQCKANCTANPLICKPGEEVCDQFSHTCQNITQTCDIDYKCPPPLICDADSGRCVDCSFITDRDLCGFPHKCVPRQPGSRTYYECEVCDEKNDTICAIHGMRCYQGRCIGCYPTNDIPVTKSMRWIPFDSCTGPEKFCNPNGVCEVNCTEENCPAPNKCHNGQCVNCLDVPEICDSRSKCVTEKRIANNVTITRGKCVIQNCLEPGYGCLPGQFCDWGQNECLTCTNSTDQEFCPPPYYCLNGVCVTRNCTTGADCELGSGCDLETGQCVVAVEGYFFVRIDATGTFSDMGMQPCNRTDNLTHPLQCIQAANGKFYYGCDLGDLTQCRSLYAQESKPRIMAPTPWCKDFSAPNGLCSLSNPVCSEPGFYCNRLTYACCSYESLPKCEENGGSYSFPVINMPPNITEENYNGPCLKPFLNQSYNQEFQVSQCCVVEDAVCPDGTTPISACFNDTDCQSSEYCDIRGTCCPKIIENGTTPRCPDNKVPLTSCQSPSSCPFGFSCLSEIGCCDSGKCPLGDEPAVPLDYNRSCPIGSVFNETVNGCCQTLCEINQTIPVLPDTGGCPFNYTFRAENNGCCPTYCSDGSNPFVPNNYTGNLTCPTLTLWDSEANGCCAIPTTLKCRGNLSPTPFTGNQECTSGNYYESKVNGCCQRVCHTGVLPTSPHPITGNCGVNKAYDPIALGCCPACPLGNEVPVDVDKYGLCPSGRIWNGDLMGCCITCPKGNLAVGICEPSGAHCNLTTAYCLSYIRDTSSGPTTAELCCPRTCPNSEIPVLANEDHQCDDPLYTYNADLDACCPVQ